MGTRIWIVGLLISLGACKQSPQASDVPSDVSSSDVLLPHDLAFKAETTVDAWAAVDAGMAVDTFDVRQDLVLGSDTVLFDMVHVDQSDLGMDRGGEGLVTSTDVPFDNGRPPFDVLPPPDLGGAYSDIADISSDSRLDVPEGWVVCTEVGMAPRAVNPRSNPSHCGACNHRCCGLFCINGMCAADGPSGTASCPLSSVEEQRLGCFGPVPIRIEVDSNNCGSCGHRCREHQECVRSQCVNQ